MSNEGEASTEATNQEEPKTVGKEPIRRLDSLRRLMGRLRKSNDPEGDPKTIVERISRLDKANRILNEANGPYSEEMLEPFLKLREGVHARRDKELESRMAENPAPSEEEERAGVYRECIEPQCRDAIFAMRGKGYSTFDSGFNGNVPIDQVVTFTEVIDPETVEKLKGIGVKYGHFEYDVFNLNYLVFRPRAADFDTIKDQWDNIAQMLPDLGKKPSEGRGAEKFRLDLVGDTRRVFFGK